MEQSPNEKLVAYYDGDKLTWITPAEYYMREAGDRAIKIFQDENDE